MKRSGKVWGTWLGTVSLSLAALATGPAEMVDRTGTLGRPAPAATGSWPPRLTPPAPAPAAAPRAEATLPPPYRITRSLVRAIIAVESGGKSSRVGAAGERGLMQIEQATWYEVSERLFAQPLSFDHAFDPKVNCQVGIAYLQHLRTFLQRHRKQWQADERQLLLACYNAGPNRVLRDGFALDKLPASTQSYIERICTLHDDYQRQSRQLAQLPRPPQH